MALSPSGSRLEGVDWYFSCVVGSLCLASLVALIILSFCFFLRQVDKEVRGDNRALKKSHPPSTKSLFPSPDDESLLASSKPLAPDKFNNVGLLVGAILTFNVLVSVLWIVLYLRWASRYYELAVCVVLLGNILLYNTTLALGLQNPVGEPMLPVSVIIVCLYPLFLIASLSLVQFSHVVSRAFVGNTLLQFLDRYLIMAALSSLPLIAVILVVFPGPRKTPSTVRFVFDEDWRLTFTTSMGVASRNSVSNNLKLRFEGLIAPLRVNWFPFASPEMIPWTVTGQADLGRAKIQH
jgi:hypothetical protein